MEAVFFVALAVATAALHYARGFSSAFMNLSSQPAAAAAATSNSPLRNYAGVLAAATAAYAATRVAARYAAAILPPSVKSSDAARRAALALCLPVTAVICYVGAGYPPLGGSVAVKWVAANWERNGERDFRWCGRLFALLFFWQAVLAGGIAACRAVVEPLRAAASGGSKGKGGDSSTSGGGGGKKLEQQPRQENSRSKQGRISSGKSSIGDGVLPTAGGREKGRPSPGENGAPGWEKEKEREGAQEEPLKACAPGTTSSSKQ